MKNSVRGLFIVVGIFASVFISACFANAADFPTKDMTIICASKAGTAIDILARSLASSLQKTLGKPVIVENRTAGTQAEALSTLLSKPADGHTLFTATQTTLGVLASTLRKQYKFEDFTWLLQIQQEVFTLVVQAESPYKDMKELFAFAKANPGKIKCGGFGTGSANHIAFLEMCELAGVNMSWIPFEGASEALTQVLGGHIDMVHAAPHNAWGLFEAKKVRFLGITEKERLGFIPDVATLREQGIDQVAYVWRALAMKAGAPKAVETRILEAVNKAMQDEEFQRYMKSAHQQSGRYVGDEFRKYALSEFDITRQRMEQLGLIK